MENLLNIGLIENILETMRTVLAYGFLLATLLHFIGYGIFKAFRLIDTYKNN